MSPAQGSFAQAFRDRSSAGRLLAAELSYLEEERPLVLALSIGGVLVAREVAQALGAEFGLVGCERGPPGARLTGGRVVVLVDEGAASPALARRTLRALSARAPRHLVFAVPVGPPDVIESLERYADEVVCLLVPSDFQATDAYYERFPVVSVEQAREALRAA